jgi:hypothetical protein
MSGGAPGAGFVASGSEATAIVGISAAAPISIRVSERETTANADPSADAVLQAVGADAGAIKADAASWWRAFWGRSSVSLPGQPGLEALWNGAAYALAATASVDPSVPPPGLYGVWATSDSCSWNGDYTLDYNAEATFFGAFASNHGAQAQSYYDYLLRWKAPGAAMAQQQAKSLGITCDAEALHYACHLAPWGFQSFDETFYMHWNGHYSTLLFINAFEYTLNASFTQDVVLPYVSGHNLWWACALNKTMLPNSSSYVYRDTRQDAQHEGQIVPDPQIGLAFAARTMASAEPLVGALRKLSEKNLSNLTPHPWYSAWHYSHPTLTERESALNQLRVES